MADSLFERLPWLYALFREHLFRDDTDRIARSLWPDAPPPAGTLLLELGCGPGRYARRLAERFAGLQAVGVDRSAHQVEGARGRAAALGLGNCRFERDDALALRRADASVDAVVAARLLTVVRDHGRSLAEMHRVLRPGGRCFLAEPRSPGSAALVLAILRLGASLVVSEVDNVTEWDEPTRATVFSDVQFATLVGSQRWGRVSLWHDTHYQYALCEKAREADRLPLAG